MATSPTCLISACTKRPAVASRLAGPPSLGTSGVGTSPPRPSVATRSTGVPLLPYVATSSTPCTPASTVATSRLVGSPRRPPTSPAVLGASSPSRDRASALCRAVAIRHVFVAASTGSITFLASCHAPSMASRRPATFACRVRAARTYWSPTPCGITTSTPIWAAVASQAAAMLVPIDRTMSTECEGLPARLAERLQGASLLHRKEQVALAVDSVPCTPSWFVSERHHVP